MKRGRTRKKDYTIAPAAIAKRRLRHILFGFLVLLSIPILFLLNRVYTQHHNEAVFQFRTQAEQLTQRIDQRLLTILDPEQQRPFAEYSFFNVQDNPLFKSKRVKLSPLSEVPPTTPVPGVLGYFQINPDGTLHTPILPDHEDSLATQSHGLSGEEWQRRIALKIAMQQLLTVEGNRVIATHTENNFRAPARYHDQGGQIQKNVVNELAESLTSLFSEEPMTSKRFRSSKADHLKQGQAHVEQEPVSPDRLEEQVVKSTNRLSTSLPIKKNQAYEQEKKSVEKQKLNPLKKLEAQTRSRKEQVRIPDQSAAHALFDQDYGLSSPAVDSSAALEKNAARESGAIDDMIANETGNQVKILTFESEVDPLQIRLLGTTNFCFFRRVWQDNGRYIQGFIVSIDGFLQSTIQPVLQASQMSQNSQLSIVFGNTVLERFDLYYPAKRSVDSRVNEKPGASQWITYQTLLAPPMNEFKLLFRAPVSGYVSSSFLLTDVLSGALALVLLAGVFGLYRLGCAQINLAQRQSNFVSAVSHELKTPLTSIRMYSEMLRSSWVLDEDKRQNYYDFIFFESERLSRLIANVLHLSKLSNNYFSIKLALYPPSSLVRLIQTKTASRFEASGFTLNLVKPETDDQNLSLLVEEDAFSQIFINLVDNAVKFSSAASRKTIDFGYRFDSENLKTIVFFVRDYGPGVEKDKMKKIFQLFYRTENELTRTTPGTGIGLSLVKQLAHQMNADVDLLNREPGAEFQVRFPVQ